MKFTSNIVLAVALGYLSATVAAQGTQFITGTCTSDADCASGCCGFNTGKCAGAVVAQERDGGCGFGDGQPNDDAAVAFRGGQSSNAGNMGNNNVGNNNAGSNNAGNNNGGNQGGQGGQGTQFITGTCASDADCASGCCGFNTGKCAGAVVAQERDGGCGFGDDQPNDDAAQALRGNNGGNNNAGNNNAGNNNAGNNNAGNNNAGNQGQGSQFITGTCAGDSDCASACCGFNTGKCAGPVIAQERDGGCGFGDAQPNDDAAQAFRAGQRKLRSRDVRFPAHLF